MFAPDFSLLARCQVEEAHLILRERLIPNSFCVAPALKVELGESLDEGFRAQALRIPRRGRWRPLIEALEFDICRIAVETKHQNGFGDRLGVDFLRL